MIIIIFFVFLLLFCDQYLKYYIANSFELYQIKELIPNFINLTYIHNDGAGWGLFSGSIHFLSVISFVASIFFVYLLYKNRHQSLAVNVSIGFLIAGTIGNLIDRLRLGYVIDMIQLVMIDFPIFNLADSYLTIGIIILIICTFKNPDKELIL